MGQDSCQAWLGAFYPPLHIPLETWRRSLQLEPGGDRGWWRGFWSRRHLKGHLPPQAFLRSWCALLCIVLGCSGETEKSIKVKVISLAVQILLYAPPSHFDSDQLFTEHFAIKFRSKRPVPRNDPSTSADLSESSTLSIHIRSFRRCLRIDSSIGKSIDVSHVSERRWGTNKIITQKRRQVEVAMWRFRRASIHFFAKSTRL